MSRVLDKAFENPHRYEEDATMPLAGGIMQNGYQCGMIWGAAMAAGNRAYRLYGDTSKAHAYAIHASRIVYKAFEEQNTTGNCYEITEIDKNSSTMDMIVYFLIKGGTIGCFRRANRYAPVAYKMIDETMSREIEDIPEELPVSCVEILADKMRLTKEQKYMISGLAGGIGLCGGACGAMGAAVWANAMKSGVENSGKIEFKDPRGLEVVEAFLKKTDYNFECSDIVGKKFENVEEHSQYIKNGGCAELLDVLASEFNAEGK